MKAKKNSGSAWLAKALITVLAVVIVGGAGWYFVVRPNQVKNQAQAASTTTTTTVQRGSISLTASGSGTLVASQSVNMSFSTSGKVVELNVKLGDMVKTGDVLARLDKAKDLVANLASAQASLLQAQQTLATLQKGAGASLAKAYQDLTTAQAAYNDALAASKLASSTVRCMPEILNKYKAALEDKTQKLSDLMKTDYGSDAYTTARYDYDTALANYNYCASYTPTEKTSAVSTLEVAKAALQKAQENYDTLKKASGIDPETLSMDETKVETAQTMVDTAQEALDGITLKAPIAGKITSLAASAGAIVDTSTFLTISDVSHPTVTVSLDETDMDKLVVGNGAEVTFTALPGKTFTGKVSVVTPQMNSFGPFRAASGQVELDESAVKTLETVPLGLSATIKITGKQAKDVLVIPVAALKGLNNGTYAVTLVDSSGQRTQQTVKIGIQNTSYVEITSGLKEGDVVSVPTKSSSSSSSNQNQQFFDGGIRPGD